MKTKRVRIAIAMNARGEWEAHGWDGTEEAMIRTCRGCVEDISTVVRMIEADIPISETETIEGRVTE